MNKKKEKTLTLRGTIAGGMATVTGIGVLATSATAAVYVAPSDVGNYQKKADQTTSDFYLNGDSMVAQGTSDKAKKIIMTTEEGEKLRKNNDPLFAGYVLERPKTSILTGTTLVTGGGFKFRLPVPTSGTYTLVSDKKTGKITLTGKGADGHAQIVLDGANAFDRGSITCLNSGKSGCYVFGQPRTNAYYNIYSGEFRLDRVMYSANGIGCGKYGSGCHSPSLNTFGQDRVIQRTEKLIPLDKIKASIDHREIRAQRRALRDGKYVNALMLDQGGLSFVSQIGGVIPHHGLFAGMANQRLGFSLGDMIAGMSDIVSQAMSHIGGSNFSHKLGLFGGSVGDMKGRLQAEANSVDYSKATGTAAFNDLKSDVGDTLDGAANYRNGLDSKGPQEVWKYRTVTKTRRICGDSLSAEGGKFSPCRTETYKVKEKYLAERVTTDDLHNSAKSDFTNAGNSVSVTTQNSKDAAYNQTQEGMLEDAGDSVIQGL